MAWCVSGRVVIWRSQLKEYRRILYEARVFIIGASLGNRRKMVKPVALITRWERLCERKGEQVVVEI
jgi:hypothetical protein